MHAYSIYMQTDRQTDRQTLFCFLKRRVKNLKSAGWMFQNRGGNGCDIHIEERANKYVVITFSSHIRSAEKKL
jgi:hypothetical protein